MLVDDELIVFRDPKTKRPILFRTRREVERYLVEAFEQRYPEHLVLQVVGSAEYRIVA